MIDTPPDRCLGLSVWQKCVWIDSGWQRNSLFSGILRKTITPCDCEPASHFDWTHIHTHSSAVVLNKPLNLPKSLRAKPFFLFHLAAGKPMCFVLAAIKTQFKGILFWGKDASTSRTNKHRKNKRVRTTERKRGTAVCRDYYDVNFSYKNM